MFDYERLLVWVLPHRMPSLGEWFRSVQWLGYTLLGGLLPTWGAWLLIRLFGQVPNFVEFVEHGEFALYTASLAAPAIFLLSLERRHGFPFRALLLFLAFALLICSTLVFAATFVAGRPQFNAGLKIDSSICVVVSIAVYILCLIVVYIVTLIDMIAPPVDALQLREMQANEDRELTMRLRRERGEQ